MSGLISQKCHYAVLAVLELAQRGQGDGPVRMADIAESRAIPPRFLEAILNQLRHAGITASVRGKVGGYRLARAPAEISVGEVVRTMQGPVAALVAGGDHGDDVVAALWHRAGGALEAELERTTIADLQEADRQRRQLPSYEI